jgi:hypothetical protein
MKQSHLTLKYMAGYQLLKMMSVGVNQVLDVVQDCKR